MSRHRTTKPRGRLAWASLPDDQLLKVRLRNLHVKVQGTWLEDGLLTLQDELAERELVMEFTILLTAKTMHALFGPSRRRWIAL